MPKAPRRPEALTNKIFRGSNAVARGLLTPTELRSSAWLRLFRGVYADRSLTPTHRMKCLAASSFLLPKGAVIAGRSAAHLWGVPYPPATDCVEVLSPHRFGPVRGLTIHSGVIDAGETTKAGRLIVTSSLRTGWDLARWFDLAEAMVYLDAMAAKHLITGADLLLYTQARARERGSAKVAKAAALIDAGAQSPPESKLRVGLIRAGLPKPVAQYEIVRDGVFLARVDLAWPRYRIAVEYDGRWHGDARQFDKDRQRLNRLLGDDWLVFHVTAAQMRDGLDELAGQLRVAMRRRVRS